MVLSKINSEISYKELKEIDENDKGRDVSMYQLNLLKIPVVIALGDIKYTFVDQNVLFAPVYLVVDEHDKIYQIGVFEFHLKELENLKDSDGDLDISLIDGPLLYSFINEPYIKKCMKNEKLVPDYDSGDDEEDEEELDDLEEGDKEEEEDDEEPVKKPTPLLVHLDIEEDDDDFLQKGEVEKDDKKERKNYKKPEKGQSSWIEHFMNNNNYGIMDNPGHGDCFFYTIRDAFEGIGVDASVKKIRDIMVEQVDGEVLNNYKERHDMIETEIKTLTREIPLDKKRKSKIAKEFNILAKESKKEKDIPTKKRKTVEAKEVKKKHTALDKEIKLKERELKEAKINYGTVKWFKNIKNLDQLKALMKTDNFWADIWAISTMELMLNVKFIILSSDDYRLGKYSSVLKCGDFVPDKIEKQKYFKPKYYIMVEHTGNHYKLITYKDKKIHRFHEIPYGMKTRITEKCLKVGKSLYSYIPKFSKLIGKTIVIPTQVVEKSEKLEETGEVVQTPSPKDKDLFNEDTVFYFYSKSSNKPPGKGAGEKIKDEDIPKYTELKKIKDWRKVLSNMHVKPTEDGKVSTLFELDGLKWASVEHYYHANKFKKKNQDYYRLFSINSGSQIMGDPKKALGAGGKGGIVKVKDKETKKNKTLFKRPRDVVMDEDFFDGKNREIVMARGQKAKYEQDEKSKEVLLATNDAKLIHYVGRGKSVVFYDTMRIRKELKKNQ
jgi:hypothetical protein